MHGITLLRAFRRYLAGVRTPFLMNNTAFKNYIAQDLGRFALKGLLTKTALDPKEVEYICMGTVIQEGEEGQSRCCFHAH
jgi:acetyl-CoA acetyltransferase